MPRAYTVAGAARALHMTTDKVREAIASGLIWAFTIDEVTRVPGEEVERVQENAARRSTARCQGNRWRVQSQGHGSGGPQATNGANRSINRRSLVAIGVSVVQRPQSLVPRQTDPLPMMCKSTLGQREPLAPQLLF